MGASPSMPRFKSNSTRLPPVFAWCPDAVKISLRERGMARASKTQCGFWVKLPNTAWAFVPSGMVDQRLMKGMFQRST